jgi:hypothetical protein
MMIAPTRHATPAMMNGVIHTTGEPPAAAESLNTPASSGPSSPATP